MGLNVRLVGFPLAVLAISVILQFGGLAATAQGSTVGFNGQSGGAVNVGTVDCTGFHYALIGGTGPCLTTSPTEGTVLCGGDTVTGQSCYVFDFCQPTTIAPLWCNPVLQKTFLQPGSSATFANSQVVSTTNSIIFAFGALGPAGFTAMLVVAVSIAGLVGMQLFGSGESPEGIHVLFMGGILLGMWFLLSAAEGFLTGSPTSFFSQLNGALSGFGSTTYILLTLMYSLGVIGAISRGGAS